MSKRVLLIEDDIQMQTLISNYLVNYDFITLAYANPKDALHSIFVDKESYDIVILDLMLPEMDGFDVAKAIKDKLDIPIIISSARGDIGNKIYGYELGVDDYLEKPYEPRELVLRIEAVLSRYSKNKSLNISGFVIDEGAYSVSVDGYPIDLTRIEFEIFVFLIKNRGKNVSREQVINATTLEYDTKARTIDTHISNIRQKIGDDAKEPHYIKSVWGIGYKFIG
ncbi:response regulator transcription factor [Sulfurimonas sp.]|uniref:response regulator transcription factor n=1 Tax=Sulfurimonas sp. TaxID=2022749 RepID=UPI0026083058|nr:response regulator transcription factor [Sulfurimonas sp.]MCW8895232.1 response regulator transcription factor [Sulfurimonas sp.]